MADEFLDCLISPYTDVFLIGDKAILYSYITGKHRTVSAANVRDRVITLPRKKINELVALHLVESDDCADSYLDYRCVRDIARYSHKALDVVLHLNYDCNLRCPYCYQNNVDKNVVMAPESLDRVSEKIISMLEGGPYKKLFLTLIGGEPTLHPEMIHRISDKLVGIKVPVSGIVVCNGTILTKQMIRDCIRIGRFTFDITLDGAEKYHDQLRYYPDGAGSFQEILENIETIQSQFPEIDLTINCNLSQKNINGVDDLCKSLKRIHYQGNLVFSEVFLSPHSSYDSVLGKRGTEWYEAVKTAESYGFINTAFSRTSHLGCGMYNSDTFFIDPFGEVSSCINAIGNPRYKQSTFINHGLVSFDFARSKRIESEGLLSSYCKLCKFLPICEGSCTYLNETVKKRCPRWSLEHNERRILQEHLIKGLE